MTKYIVSFDLSNTPRDRYERALRRKAKTMYARQIHDFRQLTTRGQLAKVREICAELRRSADWHLACLKNGPNKRHLSQALSNLAELYLFNRFERSLTEQFYAEGDERMEKEYQELSLTHADKRTQRKSRNL